VQLQETDWQTTVASNRIGPPSSWTPVAAQFGVQPAVTGMLYYSATGCFLIPDEATHTHPVGMQSLLWGPGLVPAITDQAGEHALVDLAGSQISIAADHAQALVGLALEVSGRVVADPMTLPVQPAQAQSFDGQPSSLEPLPYEPAAQQPEPNELYVDPAQGLASPYGEPNAQPYGTDPQAPAGFVDPSPTGAAPYGTQAPPSAQPYGPGYGQPAAEAAPMADPQSAANPATGDLPGALPPPPAGFVQAPEEIHAVAGTAPAASTGNDNGSLLKILILVAVGLAVIAIGYLLYSTVLSSGAAPDSEGVKTLAFTISHTLIP
jgi:hypothetical protein